MDKIRRTHLPKHGNHNDESNQPVIVMPEEPNEVEQERKTNERRELRNRLPQST